MYFREESVAYQKMGDFDPMNEDFINPEFKAYRGGKSVGGRQTETGGHEDIPFKAADIPGFDAKKFMAGKRVEDTLLDEKDNPLEEGVENTLEKEAEDRPYWKHPGQKQLILCRGEHFPSRVEESC